MTTETNTKLPPRIYVRGHIGHSTEIAKIFKDYGAVNNNGYKFGDPDAIYYIGFDWSVKTAEHDSDLKYVITNSYDWEEITIRSDKKIRRYLLTVKEGTPTCEGCEHSWFCCGEAKRKCEIGKHLQKLTNGPDLLGKTMEIKDITDCDTPIVHEDIYDY